MGEPSLNDYLDIKTFVKQNPQFKEGQIRWLIVERKKLGMSSTFKRLGRRIYIHVPSFIKWAECRDA